MMHIVYLKLAAHSLQRWPNLKSTDHRTENLVLRQLHRDGHLMTFNQLDQL